MGIRKRIRQYVWPRIKSELRKLKLPEDLRIEVYPLYLHLNDTLNTCMPYYKNGMTTGAKLLMDPTAINGWSVLHGFYHEMWHVKEVYEGKEISEFRADLHAKKRLLEEMIKWPYEALKSYLKEKKSRKKEFTIIFKGHTLEQLIDYTKKYGYSNPTEFIRTSVRLLSTLEKLVEDDGVIVRDPKTGRNLYIDLFPLNYR